ncbi:MAG: adenosine kinase [Marinilabiliales bacterium]|nr:MAG: adenosine kinase [Marinilabiliales bacterium]
MAKILGIGNALVDLLIQIEEDSFLEELNLPKGSMQLVESDIKDLIAQKSSNLKKSMASGGSAANTIHGLARLGTETSFIGTVGNDETGDFFIDDLKKSNINPLLNIGENPSGLASTLISKDGERTFGTYLGAAVELNDVHLKAEQFLGHDYLHIEGYLVFNNKLIERALILAKENGLKVSLDLASYNVVEANLDFLKEMISKYVDILFANEEEAKAFTGLEPEEALEEISKMVDIAIVKVGKEGSFIKSGNEKIKIGVIEANALDTTGAGDLYAGGFLHGLAQGKDFEYCGKLGALLAGTVIQDIGAKISDENWHEIKEEIATY